MTPLITGFLTSISLILAIGAQNAFVLRQGVMRSHVLPLVLFCAASDAILITAGVAGFGSVAQKYPALPDLLAVFGATFLLIYGTIRARAAWNGHDGIQMSGEGHGLWTALLTCAAMTWLNPHVYLDTLALIGAVSTQFAERPQKLAFGAGAVLASFVFFFALGYGARLLAPVMQSRRAWQMLDGLIALVMWAIAGGLIASVF